jgi:hypothetical protein
MDVICRLTPISSGMYDQIVSDETKESFDETDYSTSLWKVLQYIVFFWAIFLALKCRSREGGIRWGQVILAILFSPFYIAYRLARPCAKVVAGYA